MVQKTTKNNVVCRIFKEQMDLINQLPEQERATVLYLAVSNAFNQFENQNEIQNEIQFDNQFENQNENAYLSVSESIQLTKLSTTVLELLYKNIIIREFSSNYGGKRTGSGRPKTKKQESESEFSVSVDYGDKVQIGENFKIDFADERFRPYREASKALAESVEFWLIKNKLGKMIDKNFICKQITNFARRQGEFNKLMGL